MPLQTRNVFIDTEFFVKAKMDFFSNTITLFKDLCVKGEFHHISTQIVVNEIKEHIYLEIKEAFDALNKFRRKAQILIKTQDIKLNNLFQEIDIKQVQNDAHKIYSDFLIETNCKILEFDSVNPKDVFNLYFERKAPFSEKKKSEFPDAFTLVSLSNYLEKDEKIYIISEDPYLIKFCNHNKNFLNIPALSKLLDLFNTHNEEMTKSIKEFILNESSSIKAEIKKQVEDADFYNSSSWENTEVEKVEVTAISDFEPDIIYIDEDQCTLNFQVDVEYDIVISGPDYMNGTYDRELDKWFTYEEPFSRYEVGNLILNVEMEIDIELHDETFVFLNRDINVLDLNSGIEVNIEQCE